MITTDDVQIILEANIPELETDRSLSINTTDDISFTAVYNLSFGISNILEAVALSIIYKFQQLPRLPCKGHTLHVESLETKTGDDGCLEVTFGVVVI